MRCFLCDREFDETASGKTCRSCALFGGCKMVRCPWCGYDMPREPALVRMLKRWRLGKHDRSRG